MRVGELLVERTDIDQGENVLVDLRVINETTKPADIFLYCGRAVPEWVFVSNGVIRRIRRRIPKSDYGHFEVSVHYDELEPAISIPREKLA